MKHWLLILIFLPLLINCRKKQDPPPENNLSFEYNGQTFSGSANGFPILDNDYEFKGIAIHEVSIFKRVIYFYIATSGCANLVQDNAFFTLSPGCRMDVIDPADSAKHKTG